MFATPALAHRALVRTWECCSLELTPRGAGRHHYAGFLKRAAERHDLPHLAEAAEWARRSGERFDALAHDVLGAGCPTVRHSAALATRIAEVRRMVGDRPSQTAVRIVQWREQRDDLAEECELSKSQCLAAFDQVGEHFEAIEALEMRLQRVLARGRPS